MVALPSILFAAAGVKDCKYAAAMIRLFRPLSEDEAAAYAYRAVHNPSRTQQRDRRPQPRYRQGCTLGAAGQAEATQRCRPLDSGYKVHQRAVQLSSQVKRSAIFADIRYGLTLQAPNWVSAYGFTKETSSKAHRLLSVTNKEPTVLVVNTRHFGGLFWTHMVLERWQRNQRGVTWRTVPGYHFLDGEESFYLLPNKQGSVAKYAVCSVSRAAHWLAQLTYPYVQLCQYRFRAESIRFLVQRWENRSLSEQAHR